MRAADEPTPENGMSTPTSREPILARSERLMERAREVIPGGVNSPVRAFKGVGGTPPFIRSARGAFLEDVDGNRYLDYVGSWGVMLLGHAHPAVMRALADALAAGTSYGAPTEGEVLLAEALVARVPGLEVVRLVNSGTEATMSALRLARAATGRDRVVKFRGGYHGHADSFLVEAGSGAATLGIPSSPGVTAGAAADTLVADYNDLAGVQALFEAHPGEIAAVFVEPVAGNMGCVPPVDGFLDGLQALCRETGALLVFDEVMTGFRVGPGGAQARYGITPDLTTLGKVIGGGLPVGAYGGRADLMHRIAPDGPVYQAGTLSGNPLAVAAGLATLRYLDEEPGIYEHLEALGRAFDAGFGELGRRLGIPLRWNRVGAMGSLFFSEAPVTGWPSAAAASRERFTALFHGLLGRGIHLPPSPFEAWFWSYAHTPEDVERTLEAAEDTMNGADFPHG
jgi:glutamate-1-semialdehyde 2,1-aminomutase